MRQDQTFKEFCQRMIDIHEKKAHDYSKDGDRFSNFKRAAEIASWFDDPVDKVFATMLGVKISRLAELRNGKTPKNESTDDSYLDLNTYAAIWFTWFKHEDTGSKASTRSNVQVRTPKSQTRHSRTKGRKSCRGGLQS